MAKRLLLLLALSALVAAPALAGDNLGDQKAKVDSKLSHLQSTIASQRAQEGRLTNQIGSLTSQIKHLELQVGNVSQKLSLLETDLSLHQKRLDKLNTLFQLQTQRFKALERSYRLAVQLHAVRPVSEYNNGEPLAI